jgi:phage tail-like protein
MMSLIKMSYVSRWFGLVLDGSNEVGLLRSVEGGAIKTDAVVQAVGGMLVKMKGTGKPSYDPITMQVPGASSGPFWDWIKKSMDGACERKNGSILFYDATMTVVHEIQFINALVTEVSFPSLDAKPGKEPFAVGIKIQPEDLKHIPNPGNKHPLVMGIKQKGWTTLDFDFRLDTMAKHKTNKIEAFTFKQNVKPLPVGSQRVYQIEPVGLEYPNLKINVPLVDAKPYFDWADKSIVKGENKAKDDKTGTIIVKSTDHTATVLTINLAGVQILNCGVDKSDIASDRVKMAVIELSVETMDLKYA